MVVEYTLAENDVDRLRRLLQAYEAGRLSVDAQPQALFPGSPVETKAGIAVDYLPPLGESAGSGSGSGSFIFSPGEGNVSVYKVDGSGYFTDTQLLVSAVNIGQLEINVGEIVWLLRDPFSGKYYAVPAQNEQTLTTVDNICPTFTTIYGTQVMTGISVQFGIYSLMDGRRLYQYCVTNPTGCCPATGSGGSGSGSGNCCSPAPGTLCCTLYSDSNCSCVNGQQLILSKYTFLTGSLTGHDVWTNGYLCLNDSFICGGDLTLCPGNPILVQLICYNDQYLFIFGCRGYSNNSYVTQPNCSPFGDLDVYLNVGPYNSCPGCGNFGAAVIHAHITEGSCSGSSGGGSGSGSGGAGCTITNTCCSSMCATLYCTITGDSGCSCMDGTYTMTHSGLSQWHTPGRNSPSCYTVSCGGTQKLVIYLFCEPNGEFSLSYQCSDTTFNGPSGAPDTVSCSPFHLHWNSFAEESPCCGSGNISVDITS